MEPIWRKQLTHGRDSHSHNEFLTHCMPLVSLYTLYITSSFLIFSGGIQRPVAQNELIAEKQRLNVFQATLQCFKNCYKDLRRCIIKYAQVLHLFKKYHNSFLKYCTALLNRKGLNFSVWWDWAQIDPKTRVFMNTLLNV